MPEMRQVCPFSLCTCFTTWAGCDEAHARVKSKIFDVIMFQETMVPGNRSVSMLEVLGRTWESGRPAEVQ